MVLHSGTSFQTLDFNNSTRHVCHRPSTIASAVSLVRLTTVVTLVNPCIQHDRRNTTRRAGPSAVAETWPTVPFLNPTYRSVFESFVVRPCRRSGASLLLSPTFERSSFRNSKMPQKTLGIVRAKSHGKRNSVASRGH